MTATKIEERQAVQATPVTLTEDGALLQGDPFLGTTFDFAVDPSGHCEAVIVVDNATNVTISNINVRFFAARDEPGVTLSAVILVRNSRNVVLDSVAVDLLAGDVNNNTNNINVERVLRVVNSTGVRVRSCNFVSDYFYDDNNNNNSFVPVNRTKAMVSWRVDDPGWFQYLVNQPGLVVHDCRLDISLQGGWRLFDVSLHDPDGKFSQQQHDHQGAVVVARNVVRCLCSSSPEDRDFFIFVSSSSRTLLLGVHENVISMRRPPSFLANGPTTTTTTTTSTEEILLELVMATGGGPFKFFHNLVRCLNFRGRLVLDSPYNVAYNNDDNYYFPPRDDKATMVIDLDPNVAVTHTIDLETYTNNNTIIKDYVVRSIYQNEIRFTGSGPFIRMGGGCRLFMRDLEVVYYGIDNNNNIANGMMIEVHGTGSTVALYECKLRGSDRCQVILGTAGDSAAIGDLTVDGCVLAGATRRCVEVSVERVALVRRSFLMGSGGGLCLNNHNNSVGVVSGNVMGCTEKILNNNNNNNSNGSTMTGGTGVESVGGGGCIVTSNVFANLRTASIFKESPAAIFVSNAICRKPLLYGGPHAALPEPVVFSGCAGVIDSSSNQRDFFLE
jgi:hypothetical protein